MDDFLASGATRAVAQQLLDRMISLAEGLGFTIQRQKVDIGQALVPAGVLFDVQRMVIGMTATQAASAQRLWMLLAHQVRAGLGTVHWGDAHSLVSRLQWKSMVLLQGASELSYLWKLINFMQSTSRHAVSKALDELGWWIDTLTLWELDDLSPNRPLLSATHLRDHPEAVTVMACDASGAADECAGGMYGPMTAGVRQCLASAILDGRRHTPAEGAQGLPGTARHEAPAEDPLTRRAVREAA